MRRQFTVLSIFAVCVLILWVLLTSMSIIPSYVLPSPTSVLLRFVRDPSLLLLACLNTLLTALAGFTMAFIIGLVFGAALFQSRTARSVLLPIFISLKSTPIIAIVPIVTLYLKVGLASKLLLSLTACFFPMILSTYMGLNTVPLGLRDYACALGSSRKTYFWLISLPSAANEIALGIRITLPLAFVGAVVAEMAGGDDSGIGYIIISASYRLDSSLLYLSVILLMAISTLTFYLVTALIARINPSYREGV